MALAMLPPLSSKAGTSDRVQTWRKDAMGQPHCAMESDVHSLRMPAQNVAQRLMPSWSDSSQSSSDSDVGSWSSRSSSPASCGGLDRTANPTRSVDRTRTANEPSFAGAPFPHTTAESDPSVDAADLAPDGDGEWSVGSAQHDLGGCKPCSYFRKNQCREGRSCEFCHFSHQRIRQRPNKKRRAQAKRAMATMGLHEGNAQEMTEELSTKYEGYTLTDAQKCYLRNLVTSRARKTRPSCDTAENVGAVEAGTEDGWVRLWTMSL